MAEVTASTKTWEGDYREVLTNDAMTALLGPLGSARRQVVLNRIEDTAEAERRAARLVDDGVIDAWSWAEERWPALARELGVPVRWFGPAWPYSAPELCELAMATTPFIAHVAGDVGLVGAESFVARAVVALTRYPRVTCVTPLPPAGAEHLLTHGHAVQSGWIETKRFSDQCFVARRQELLAAEVVRSAGPATSPYPKPGGALTFEARVAAWMDRNDRVVWTDESSSYIHPIRGAEGGTYGATFLEPLPPLNPLSSAYPKARSVSGTGLIVVRNGERFIGEAVQSLSWLERVKVVDQQSTDRTVARAAAGGAEVRHGPVTGMQEPARRDAIDQIGSGWIVMLDADEICPAPLATRLTEVIGSRECVGVAIPRVNYAFGTWVPAGDRWPDRQLRAVRAEHVVAPLGVHEHMKVNGPVVELPADRRRSIVHFNYSDLDDWLDRTNRYTTRQAGQIFLDRNVSTRAAVRAFLTSFVRDRGFRLGRDGLRVALLRGANELLMVEKWAQLVEGGAPRVLADYDDIAQTVLRGEW